MGNYKAFKIISDAFYGYYSLLQECRKCDKFCSNKLHYYIIKDVISVSFIIEIGFKALLAYEGKKADCTHNLIDLFELLSTEKQELLVNTISCSMAEFKNTLAENSNNFIKWRYYFEILESDKRLTSSDGFMDKLLSGIAIVICDLIEESSRRTDKMFC